MSWWRDRHPRARAAHGEVNKSSPSRKTEENESRTYIVARFGKVADIDGDDGIFGLVILLMRHDVEDVCRLRVDRMVILMVKVVKTDGGCGEGEEEGEREETKEFSSGGEEEGVGGRWPLLNSGGGRGASGSWTAGTVLGLGGKFSP